MGDSKLVASCSHRDPDRHFETASREKTKIENEQRQRRKDEIAAETPWKLKYFVHAEEDPKFATLARLFRSPMDTEDTYVFQKEALATRP